MKVIVVFIIFLTTSNFLFGKKNIEGIYYSNISPDNNKIVFKKNGTFYIINKIKKLFQYTDTLSFGKYKISGKNIIKLTSYYQNIQNFQIAYNEINVTERQGENTDSLYFLIKNDFENNFCKNEKYKNRPLYYNLYVYGDTIYDLRSLSNEFQIPNMNSLRFFDLIVVPDNYNFSGYLALKKIFSDYHPKNKDSNIFIIDIPELNVHYLTCKRLYSEIILIKNKNTIIWQGVEYKRKNVESR